MKLKDGVEFKLGMTVYKENGDEVVTDTVNWKVESTTLDSESLHLLSRRGGFGEIDLQRLYSSRAAIICDHLRHATTQIRHWTSEVVRLSKLLTEATT